MKKYKKQLIDQMEDLLKNNPLNDIEISTCLHDQCPECHGTGKKHDGSMCIHFISCSCPKCTPR